jgi:hypothetical protein
LAVFGVKKICKKGIIIQRFIKISFSAALLLIAMNACVNPFAPMLDNNPIGNDFLGDQRTLDGFFKNFKYAYQFKDTLVYGRLLADDFTFIYRDFSVGSDLSWGRGEEMASAFGMFQSAASLDLVWNSAAQTIGDSLVVDISRSFSLSVELNPSDIMHVYGRALFRLKRPSTDSVWKILTWRDESTY